MPTQSECYAILGIAQNVSPDEIKRAYRRLALLHHPDKGGSEDLFKQISEAYAILTGHAQPSLPFDASEDWPRTVRRVWQDILHQKFNSSYR